MPWNTFAPVERNSGRTTNSRDHVLDLGLTPNFASIPVLPVGCGVGGFTDMLPSFVVATDFSPAVGANQSTKGRGRVRRTKPSSACQHLEVPLCRTTSASLFGTSKCS